VPFEVRATVAGVVAERGGATCAISALRTMQFGLGLGILLFGEIRLDFCRPVTAVRPGAGSAEASAPLARLLSAYIAH
jgi:hypothetical protein